MTLSTNPIKLTSEGSQSLIITNLREYDSRKHSVIFLDREWFKEGDLFSFGNFKLVLTGKFKRLSENETVYTVQLHTGDPSKFVELKTGDRLVYLGNITPKRKSIEEVKQSSTKFTVEYTGTNPFTHERLLREEKRKLEKEKINFNLIEEPLYKEEELVPNQFFGLKEWNQINDL